MKSLIAVFDIQACC